MDAHVIKIPRHLESVSATELVKLLGQLEAAVSVVANQLWEQNYVVTVYIGDDRQIGSYGRPFHIATSKTATIGNNSEFWRSVYQGKKAPPKEE